jgi:site-specific DNA recombinase
MSPTDQPSETGDLPVIAYIRVASADADDQTLSVERQRAEISAAADRLGLTISQEFIDLGTSGRTLDRPALRHLLDYITTRQVGYCVVARLDRLSRDPVQYADLDEVLSDAKVVIVDASRHAGEAPR